MRSFVRSFSGLFAFFFLLAAFILPSPSFGAPIAEYKVKAAFLLKLADFVDWPSEMANMASNPIRVGVVGPDPFGELLPEDITPAEDGCGFSFKVTRISPQDESITSYNMLFFSGSNQDAFYAVQNKIAENPILTVGDGETFLARGGMIAFTLKNNRVHFSANLKSFRRAHLNISAQLLELAERVVK